jgi:hypothetical protein
MRVLADDFPDGAPAARPVSLHNKSEAWLHPDRRQRAEVGHGGCKAARGAKVWRQIRPSTSAAPPHDCTCQPAGYSPWTTTSMRAAAARAMATTANTRSIRVTSASGGGRKALVKESKRDRG